MRPQSHLYRAHYLHPNGRKSYVTFASLPRDALRWASDWCRYYVQGELLRISEDRALTTQQQFTLRG